MSIQLNAYTKLDYRFNGKELDPETGNYYYGARYYDPKISVWLSVDPLAHKYPSLSPYNFVANNPIMLIDPDGRHIETPILDKEDENYNEKAATAFLEFAKSDEGQSFLQDYASEGQEIGGITYGQGKYDKEGLDVSFGITDLSDSGNPNGQTTFSQSEDGRSKINILLNTESSDFTEFNSGEIGESVLMYNLVGTITHESFIHGDLFAGDFSDDGNFNYSNVPGRISGSLHHYKAHSDALNHNGRFANQGYSLMKKMNSKYNVFNPAFPQVWNKMWNFAY